MGVVCYCAWMTKNQQLAAPGRELGRPVPLADMVRVMATWSGGLKPGTQVAYDRNLEVFARWLRSKRKTQTAGARDAVQWLVRQSKLVAESTVLEWLGELLEGRSSKTVRHYRSAIRSAVECCAVLGVVPWTLKAKMPKGVERETARKTDGPTFDQLGAILRAAADQDPLKAARDVAMLRLITSLRVRVTEICKLKMKDYVGGTVILVLKGHREGVEVTVPGNVQDAINYYLDLRGQTSSEEPLFASLDQANAKHEHLTRFGLFQLVRTLSEAAGVKGVSPHRLLHTASTTLADIGTSTDNLKRWGRWEKRETAETYIDRSEKVPEKLASTLDDMTEAMMRRKP